MQQNSCPYSVPLQFFSLLGRSFKFIALQNCSKISYSFSLCIYALLPFCLIYFIALQTQTHTNLSFNIYIMYRVFLAHENMFLWFPYMLVLANVLLPWHDHGNSYKKKTFNWELLIVSEVYFFILIAYRQTWCWKSSERSLSGSAGSRKKSGPGLGFWNLKANQTPVTCFLQEGHTYPKKATPPYPSK